MSRNVEIVKARTPRLRVGWSEASGLPTFGGTHFGPALALCSRMAPA